MITLLPIAALYVFGGATLQDFAFAIMVGIVIGAVGTIFIATPLLATLMERDPEYARRKQVEESEAESLRQSEAAHRRRAGARHADGHDRACDRVDHPRGRAAARTARTARTARVEGDGDDVDESQSARDAKRERRRQRRKTRPHGRAR